jgi:ZIP family zinc transporter
MATTLLVSAITHNIPEGLAVGVLFWWSRSWDRSYCWGCNIGYRLNSEFSGRNAVSMPLRRMGMSRWKSFMYGQSSALVEPIAAVLGFCSYVFTQFYPMLCFCGRCHDLCGGRSQRRNRIIIRISPRWVCWGFIVMMVLDVALG